jgi:hypothetical protein
VLLLLLLLLARLLPVLAGWELACWVLPVLAGWILLLHGFAADVLVEALAERA